MDAVAGVLIWAALLGGLVMFLCWIPTALFSESYKDWSRKMDKAAGVPPLGAHGVFVGIAEGVVGFALFWVICLAIKLSFQLVF
jgi:hypothetical protein